MGTNRSFESVKLADNYLLIKKARVEESLSVLKNAHHSLKLTLNKIEELAIVTDNAAVRILQDEMDLIEEEIDRLNHLIK